MMKFVLYVCLFVLSSTIIEGKLGNRNENYNVCLTENNVSDDDMFSITDILENKHTQSENQEKLKKNGCVLQCLLQKEGVMQEAEYDEEKIRSSFTKKTNVKPGEEMFEALNNCINETKNLTEKCEKSLALTECVIKAEERIFNIHKLKHKEHEDENKSEK
ncbi:hypothetical protein PUN28_002041 [Cardiocondyla obscurior]